MMNVPGGNITIKGGIVTANDFIGGNNRENIPGFTFSGGVIFTPSIKNKDDKENWEGLLFEDEQGRIYGDEISLNTNLTIPSGHTLTIENGQKLTLDNCTLTLEEGATIENGGTIDAQTITYHSNYGDTEETRVQYTGKKVSVPTDLFTRQYHTFKGWYADADDETDEAIEKVSETKDLYAHWTPNTFTLNQLPAPTLTYGTKMDNITLSTLLSEGAEADCGQITFSVSGLPTGLECNDGVISGTPTAASTDEGSKVTITAEAANTSKATLTPTFTVAPAEPTLAFDTEPYEITYGESGVNIQISSNSTGSINYAYYTNQECTEGRTDNQPTNAGSYWVKATIAKTTNYKGKSVTTTFVINKGTITVTPPHKRSNPLQRRSP
ncbi:MAG: InlB B-repeat-containing protein [Parabacteroides sp.]|nr:InlB B-repeat-containing protein [Parabacteroides sp.]